MWAAALWRLRPDQRRGWPCSALRVPRVERTGRVLGATVKRVGLRMATDFCHAFPIVGLKSLTRIQQGSAGYGACAGLRGLSPLLRDRSCRFRCDKPRQGAAKAIALQFTIGAVVLTNGGGSLILFATKRAALTRQCM